MKDCIKIREIPVEKMHCIGYEARIERAIGVLKGIRQVNADYQKGLVAVEYDLMEVGLKQIEEQLQKVGCNLGGGFYTFKSNLLHFTEENEKSNLLSSHGECCSNPKFLDKK